MLLILAVLGVAVFLHPVASGQPADLVLDNANIHTVDPDHPKAMRVAIRNGRIADLDNDASKLIGPSTKVIDLRGQTVVPGFIDAHGHMRGLGESLESLDLRDAASAAAVAAQVKAAASAKRPGEWITGRGWDQTRWEGGEFPQPPCLRMPRRGIRCISPVLTAMPPG